ncbi:MAG: hypothetical protein Q9M50_02195 [Methylococcales bacterium]|nr:hypothetical protein [Methylococcales bacterium]
MKDDPETRINLMSMLEDLEKNLDDVFEEEKLFENRVAKKHLEIEKALLSDVRFNLKTKKDNS